jgi:hypothetical protein
LEEFFGHPREMGSLHRRTLHQVAPTGSSSSASQGSGRKRHERRQDEPSALIIDGTERRRQRRKNPEKQALHYSGKKKAPSDKNLVIVNAQSKRVGYLSGTDAGKTHDKKVAEAENIRYPRQSTLYKDSGFQGSEPRVQRTCHPKKSRDKGP